MNNGSSRNGSALNGHKVTIIVGICQVLATLAGGGMFIRSVERAFDDRMNGIERKVDLHMAASKRSELSMKFHHSVDVKCARGCHVERGAEFGYDPPEDRK